jgi:hypothetical protein
MSCGCSSTTTPSPSITCGSCGYQCTSCTCPVDPIVMPTVTCADPATCQEIYPLECVQYTGEDIKCSTEASTLYPNVTHIVATNGDMLPNILNNINNQLCYFFSADFISQMLTNIQEDTTGQLSSVLCSILANCPDPPASSLNCPIVSYLTYNVDPIQNYLQAQFNYVPYATNYIYKFYVENSTNSNTYTAVGGGSLLQPSTTLPITISAVLSGTLYTSSRKYIVLVQAIDSTSTYTSKGPDLSGTYTGSTLTSVQYNAILASNPNYCGNNVYVQSTPSELTCSLKAINAQFKQDPSDINTIDFIFTHETLTTGSYPPVNYMVHWYLQESTATPPSYIYKYNYQDDIIISYSAGITKTIPLTKNYFGVSWSRSGTNVTITNVNHGLVTGGTITIATSVGSGAIPAGTYTVIYLTQNTFRIVGYNTGGTTGILDYTTGIKPTDKVVVMITTYTSNVDYCFNGLSERVNGYYTDTEITGYIANPQNNVFKNFQ